jgi:hypothetical protein
VSIGEYEDILGEVRFIDDFGACNAMRLRKCGQKGLDEQGDRSQVLFRGFSCNERSVQAMAPQQIRN